MKKYLRLSIVLIGTIGILALTINEAFIIDPEHPFKALNLFKYFTVQSNLVAVIYFCILISLKLDKTSKTWKNLVGGVMIYTTITFLIYAIILERMYAEEGLGIVGNICLHYVNPLLIIGYVVTFRDEFDFKMKDSLYWLMYPVVYLIFLSIWGIITGDFLYPFFQVSEVGVVGFLFMITALIGLFFMLSFLVVKILSKK